MENASNIRQETILGVAKIMKRRGRRAEILKYLDEQQVSFEDHDQALHLARMSYLPKQFKTICWSMLGISFAVFLAFILFLPNTQLVHSPKLFAIIGAATCGILTVFGFMNFNLWAEHHIKNNRTPDFDITHVVIVAIISLILYFIFSWSMSAGADRELKENQVSAIGVIMDGESYRGRRSGSSSKVHVKFVTEDGREIRATEKVSEFEFDRYYVGQQVSIIYSRNNPLNIEIFTNEGDIREFTGSEERNIVIEDLILLFGTHPDRTEKKLNSISIGWLKSEAKNIWTNKNRKLVIEKADGMVRLIAMEATAILYERQLIAYGFNNLGNGSASDFPPPKQLNFESKEHVASIERTTINGYQSFIITINEK